MAIDLTVEKELKLTTQEVYDILDFAVQAAEDNGFMNSFIFHRAIYLFAAVTLYPDRKEELSSIVAENINTAWSALLKDGTLEDMQSNFAKELDFLAENGRVWFEDFTTYAHSARGLLNTIQEFSGDIVKAAAEQLQSTASNNGVQEVLDIANKWGMNNAPAEDEESLY